jgi:metal-sulfur cluster biosynthetic enzyme
MTPDTDMTTRLLEALRDVEDPEMPVNIVDLGLVVSLQEANGVVDVALTFTAMGCPAMEMIIDDSRARLLAEPGVRAVNVDVVWDPIWTKNRVSEDGKMQLRAFGISI